MDTSSYLPPKYSLNSFFVRHVAHPKRMRYISGLNNSKICAVNDVGYIHGVMGQPTSAAQFPPNNFNDALLRNSDVVSGGYSKRKERAVPPNGMWQTFGMNKWRSELNSLASSIGLITQSDIEEMRQKRERDEMIKSMQAASKKPESHQQQRKPPQTGSNGGRLATGNVPQTSGSTRLNEPLPTGRRRTGASRRASRGLTGASRGGATGSRKFLVDQADREAWMLQVLCQILQTENLVDVQSWLVSASDSDKEKVKQLIDQAMKGLEEAGRIESSSDAASWDQAQATAAQENYKSTISELEDHLNKIDLNKYTKPEEVRLSTTATSREKLSSSSSSSGISRDRIKLPKMNNALTVDDDSAALKKKLESIPEVLQIPDNEGARVTSPQASVAHAQTGILSINLKNDEQQPKKLLPLIENTVVKLETPMIGNSKDYKIEQVKVTMLVKDENTNSLQEINGDWRPEQQN